MQIIVTAVTSGKARRVGWVSLQPKGSLSVGLGDKTFLSPDFNVQNFVWSAFNRVTVQYHVQPDAKNLKLIRNPHLSFHPPHLFHLKGSKQKELWEGIGDLGLMLKQDGRVPWIRFISKRVSELQTAGLPEKHDRSKKIEIGSFEINPRSDQSSIGLALDFLPLGANVDEREFIASAVYPCEGYSLHIHAAEMPAQIATLAWFHQY